MPSGRFWAEQCIQPVFIRRLRRWTQIFLSLLRSHLQRSRKMFWKSLILFSVWLPTVLLHAQLLVKEQGVERDGKKVLQELVPAWENAGVQLQDGLYTYTPSTTSGSIIYPQRLVIDHTRDYMLSGEFKAVADQDRFLLGVIQYNERGKVIYDLNINRRQNTLTVLSETYTGGSDRIVVEDASNWKPGARIAIAPAEDNSDLPCFDLAGSVRKLEQHEGNWSVYLENPLKTDIASGTKVCLHVPTTSHFYVCATKAPSNFEHFGGKINWWPGAKTFKIILISRKPLEFKNLKLEIMEGDK